LDQKSQLLPELRSAAQTAEDRFKEAEKAVEQQKKIGSLKDELVWAHIKEKRDVSSVIETIPNAPPTKSLFT